MANDIIIRIRADNGQFDSDIARAQARLNQLSGTSRNASESVGILSNSVGGLQSSLMQLGVGFSLANVMREILTAGQALDGIKASFTATFGSAGVGRELEYTKKVAKDLGLEVTSLQVSYSKWAAAAKGTSIEGLQQKKVFEAVAQASRVLNLSVDDTEGTLRALSQMISKGKVQAEELRGQLGERLPGAYAMAARAMGVTQAELGKMMEQGKLMAEDLLPKLAIELNKTYGGEAKDKAVKNLAAETNRLKNSITDLYTAIYGNVSDELANWARSSAGAFQSLSNHVGLTLVPLTMLGTYFAGKGLASLVSYVAATRAQIVAGSQAAAVNNMQLRSAVAVAEAELVHRNAIVAQTQARIASATAVEAAVLQTNVLIPAQLRAAAAVRVHAAALVTLREGLVSTSLMARTMSGALALIGGPLGAAVIGIGALTYGIVKAKEASDEHGKSIVDLNGNYVRYNDITKLGLSLNEEYLSASGQRKDAIIKETAALREKANAEITAVKAQLETLQSNYAKAKQADSENASPTVDENGNLQYAPSLVGIYDKDIQNKKKALAELELQLKNIAKVEAANAAGQVLSANSLKLSTEATELSTNAYEQHKGIVKQDEQALKNQADAAKKAADAIKQKLESTRSLIEGLIKQRIELEQGTQAATFFENRLKGLEDTEARLAGEAGKYNAYLKKRSDLMGDIAKLSGGREERLQADLKNAGLTAFNYSSISQQTNALISLNDQWKQSLVTIEQQSQTTSNTIISSNNAIAESTIKASHALTDARNSFKLTADSAAKAAEVIKQLQSLGWSKNQAIGIAANLKQESEFDTHATGDGGRSRGIAQWNGSRLANLEAFLGKSIDQSNLAEQVAFLHHEMTRGAEKGAGNRLKAANSIEQSAAIVSRYYERPLDTKVEMERRAGIAQKLNEALNLQATTEKRITNIVGDTVKAKQSEVQQTAKTTSATQQKLVLDQSSLGIVKAQGANMALLNQLSTQQVGTAQLNELSLLDQVRYSVEHLKASQDQLDTTQLTGRALLEQQLVRDKINPALADSIKYQAALADYTTKEKDLKTQIAAIKDPNAALKAELDKTRMDNAQKLSILSTKELLDFEKSKNAVELETQAIGKSVLAKNEAKRVTEGMTKAHAAEIRQLEHKKAVLEEEDKLTKALKNVGLNKYQKYSNELQDTTGIDAGTANRFSQKQELIDYRELSKSIENDTLLIGKNTLAKEEAKRVTEGMTKAHAAEIRQLDAKRALLEEEDRLLKEKAQLAAIGEKAKYKLGLTQNGMDDKTADAKATDHMGNLYQSRMQELAMQRQEKTMPADDYERLTLSLEGYEAAQIRSMMTQEKANEKLGELKRIGGEVYGKISENLLQTVMTGKADWGGLVNYMVQEALKLMVIKPLMDSLTAGFSGGMGGLFGGLFANGGAFTGGVQMFATGGVVSSPTAFGMSGGKMGIMGEAGPEAIMPLTRTAGGALGVRMETPILPTINVMPQILLNAAQPATMPINNNNNAMPSIKFEVINQTGQSLNVKSTQSSRNQDGGLTFRAIVESIKNDIAADIRDGGGVRDSIADTFNLRPAVY